jgi:hypothetical protein
LVIEIDLTSTTNPEDHQAIGVPELWLYRRDRLLIYCFDGKPYRECQISPHFRDRDIKTLMLQYVNRGWHVGSSVALRAFEQFLREGA